MSSQAVRATAGRTLRHWTVSTREFVGGSQRPAPAPPFSERPEGSTFRRLASKLAEVKSELTRRIR